MAFPIQKFQTPDIEFFPGYFWVLDCPMTEENMREMLQDMKEHKALSICMHPCPKGWDPVTEAHPHYMSEEYLRLMEKVYAEADSMGMHHYLYDEGGFPSGSALGEVLASDPERFARQYYVWNSVRKAYEFFKDTPGNTPSTRYPNLLEKGVGERFIQLSHERHKAVAGKFFGKSILYTFTDEPVYPGGAYVPGQPMVLGWCSDFSEEFFRRKGYRIEPHLKEAGSVPSPGDSEEVRRYRIDYCDVRSRLFVERYLYPIRDWAEKNHLASGGHFGGDDCPEANYMAGFGHILRSLRAMDLPGVDLIWRQIYPRTEFNGKKQILLRRKLDPIDTAERDVPFTKYASSIARQSGRNRVLSEDFAVYGSGLTPRVMKYVIDHQLLRGATNFVFSNIPHGYHGPLLSGGCRPKFGPTHPFWDWFDLIHTYTARMASMLSRGKPRVCTLVYFDIPSIWCGSTVMEKAVKEHLRSARELLERHIDFDFADDDALASGKIVNGKFKVGVISYDTLVIPPENRMFDQARKKVEKFRRHGGKVVTTKEIAQLPSTVEIRSRFKSHLRAVKRQSGKETLYFLTNGSRHTVNAFLTVPEKGEVHFWDGWNAKRYRVPRKDGKIFWKFPPFSSALFVVNSSAKVLDDFPSFRGGRSKRILRDNWTIQPLRQCVFEKEVYEIRKCSAPACPVELGDWRKVLGEHFSGEALYKLEFDSPSGKKAKLSIGQVNYVSHVTLNGKVLGRTFSDPGEFFTEGILKKGKNTLEIRVVNTLANAILDPEVMEYWKKNHPSNFLQEIQYTFERESLPSGLFGPVTLHFAAGNG